MNSPVELHVHRSLELLARLKEVAAEFAQKESRLARDFRLRHMEESRKYHEETEAQENRAAAESAEAETQFAESAARVRAISSGRHSRIERARKRGMEDLLEQAKRARARGLMKLQMRHLSATRNLPVQLSAEDEAFSAIFSSARNATTGPVLTFIP